MEYVFVPTVWIGYCALHSFLISIWFTDRMNRVLKKWYAFYRIFYVLISLILLVPLIQLTTESDTRIIITYAPPWSIIRSLLLSGALLIFFWAFFFNYDFLSFFGIRQILNYKKTKGETVPAPIRKNGLLGIVRHPMYFALIIYLWCQTFRMMDIIINVVLTIYVIIGTRLEEKKLVHEFGSTYLTYQQEVPMLLPFTKRMVKQSEH